MWLIEENINMVAKKSAMRRVHHKWIFYSIASLEKFLNRQEKLSSFGQFSYTIAGKVV